MAECGVRRAIQGDVPGRRGGCGESVPAQMAGWLRLPGLWQQERGSAQAEVLRPPVPRLQEADVGDGWEFHAPLARAAEELVPGAAFHHLAFERDVGIAAPGAVRAWGATSRPRCWRTRSAERWMPPLGGRSHESRLMIAGAVEVFETGSSVPIILQFRSGMSRLGFGFDAPRPWPEA